MIHLIDHQPVGTGYSHRFAIRRKCRHQARDEVHDEFSIAAAVQSDVFPAPHHRISNRDPLSVARHGNVPDRKSRLPCRSAPERFFGDSVGKFQRAVTVPQDHALAVLTKIQGGDGRLALSKNASVQAGNCQSKKQKFADHSHRYSSNRGQICPI